MTTLTFKYDYPDFYVWIPWLLCMNTLNLGMTTLTFTYDYPDFYVWIPWLLCTTTLTFIYEYPDFYVWIAWLLRMTTLTEVCPCFFLSCWGKCQGKTRKDGARPAIFLVVVLLCIFFLSCSMYFCVLCIVCFVTFSVLFVCICVLYYCHRVATQLQLTDISYIISIQN